MILFFGDVHGNFRHVLPAVRAQRPAAIIFLGDIQAPRPLQEELREVLPLTEVYFIHGNHDTDSDESYANLFDSELAERNLHGRVVEIAGLRIAGLGGVFRGQVWNPQEQEGAAKFDSAEQYTANCGAGNRWRGGLPRKHRSTIFPAEYLALSRQQADILVTHEAPSCHPHGFVEIETLAACMEVTTMFHGHHHDRLDYSTWSAKTDIRAFGVGFCGITDQDGNVIAAGNFDENRMNRQHQIFSGKTSGSEDAK